MGSGCCCHAAELKRGEQVECWRKGRRLQAAWGHASRQLNAGLLEAESWGPSEFHPLDIEFMSECQGVVRLVVGVAFEKLRFLDRLPYLLARWGEGNIRERALEQFASVPVDRHEPITLEFLEIGSKLRDLIDRETEAGALQHREFQIALAEIRNIPFDDSHCESPHARATRVGSASRRSAWPWIASSVRLKQNIALLLEA